LAFLEALDERGQEGQEGGFGSLLFGDDLPV
jgi:hypothetical protein